RLRERWSPRPTASPPSKAARLPPSPVKAEFESRNCHTLEKFFRADDNFAHPFPPYLARGDECRHRSRWRGGCRLTQTASLNRRRSMKVKTNVKASGTHPQHNQTVARGLKVKTNVKSGGSKPQHNQTVARELKVKTNVRAGGDGHQHNQTVSRGLKVQ